MLRYPAAEATGNFSLIANYYIKTTNYYIQHNLNAIFVKIIV